MVPTSTRNSSASIPQEKQTPAENSYTSPSAPAPPKQSTVIHGDYFAGAKDLIFKQQNEFNRVGGDMVVEEDESEKTSTQRAASPQRGYRPSSPSSYSSSAAPPGASNPSNPLSNPRWAPGTSITGQYFAGAAGINFLGDNEFNSVEGTMVKVKTRRPKNTVGNAGLSNPRIVDLSQKKQNNPGGSSTSPSRSPPPNMTVPTHGGEHIGGVFFAGAHEGQFAGKNEFNAVGQNLYKTIYVEESQSTELHIEGSQSTELHIEVAEELAELQGRSEPVNQYHSLRYVAGVFEFSILIPSHCTWQSGP
ncbi:hypothetical protein EV360DRAFT_65739 [Lentinula raphanica]|nr:hypothetical protein EV360DRAFT_65739 [Lentinula raphanica]